MGLLQNIAVLNAEPIKNMGGSSGNIVTRSNYNRPEQHLNKYVGQGGFNQLSGVPNGYRHPYSYDMPWKSGGLSSYKFISGLTTVDDLNLAGGVNGLVDILCAGDITTANLGMIVQLVVAIYGSGVLDADIVGTVYGSADIMAAGDIYSAYLGAITDLQSTINGVGDINSAILRALAYISAHIYINQSQETVTQIVDGVWNALKNDYTEAGSMGEAMGAAGTAGDPWTTDLSGYSDGQAGYHVLNKLLTVVKFLGLK